MTNLFLCYCIVHNDKKMSASWYGTTDVTLSIECLKSMNGRRTKQLSTCVNILSNQYTSTRLILQYPEAELEICPIKMQD